MIKNIGYIIVLLLLLTMMLVGLRVLDKPNINCLNKTRISEIDGIGDKTADKIVSYIDDKGEINNMNELEKIDGIGKQRVIILKQKFKTW